jgi:hypothetical protein
LDTSGSCSILDDSKWLPSEHWGKLSIGEATVGENPSAKGCPLEVSLLTKIPLIYCQLFKKVVETVVLEHHRFLEKRSNISMEFLSETPKR